MNNGRDDNRIKKEATTEQVVSLKNRVRYLEKRIENNKKLLDTLANNESRELNYYRKRMENYNNLKSNKTLFRKNSELETYYMSSRTRLNKLEDDIAKMKKEIINLEEEREGVIKTIGDLISKGDKEEDKDNG